MTIGGHEYGVKATALSSTPDPLAAAGHSTEASHVLTIQKDSGLPG